MNFLYSSILVLLVVSLGYARLIAPSRAVLPRVAEGEEAKRGQFPYQVALTLKRQTVCGGVMVHERFFLTAAHCFFKGETPVPVEELNVFYGSEKLFSGGKYNRVKTVHFHEEYDHGFKYDLALVEVKRKFEFSFTAQPVAFGLETFGESMPATVSGYGRATVEGNMMFRLKYAELTSLSDAECREATGDNYYEGVFCMDTTSGAGLCMGDYGGPAVANQTLVGVGSYTVGGNCGEGQPDVFVDVGHFSSWVQSKLEPETEE
ncbi:serine protease SP24D-like [Anopheles ziemanni]|uniref:serine protease SP24D-like n=1 Tax=Anopheles coustani TaxID=139045 RepID=UPI00265AB75E|nr:serine protease SP24D-like [Anopheles coustani]XP_058178192.1 serine protease SP24D-like [Anopheles ziemanni]